MTRAVSVLGVCMLWAVCASLGRGVCVVRLLAALLCVGCGSTAREGDQLRPKGLPVSG